MEQIDSRQIHLWLAFPDEIADARLLGEYSSLLSEAELAKQERFHFRRDRHRYLVTRAMLRTVLSRYADVEPGEWRFSVNPCGRPSIAQEHKAAAGIEFNLSHTDGLVVLALARGRQIGVDAENVLARTVDIGIAQRYFAPAEVTALRSLPDEQQQRRFFEYWTLKESYIKARGQGLSIPLDRFAFDLTAACPIQFTAAPDVEHCPQRWVFWQWQPTQNHLAALCAERADAACLEFPQPRSWS